MPELPEVETIKRGLSSLVGQKIGDVKIHHFGLRYKIDSNLAKTISNQTITQIYRRAKYLIFKLTNGYLIIHLGMSGSLTLRQNPAPDKKKHDHVEFIFAKQTLTYNDPRRFGAILYTDSPDTHVLIAKLGVEPLESEFNTEYLMQSLHGKKATIKQLIMNNHIIVGVGNIYACEALFLAHILPTRIANSITAQEAEKLVAAIKEVLALAIKMGGSSLRDYKQADNTMGYFQTAHNVYGKANKPCPICNGNISQKRLGQRNSFFCLHCQH